MTREETYATTGFFGIKMPEGTTTSSWSRTTPMHSLEYQDCSSKIGIWRTNLDRERLTRGNLG
jgi:hypothetical protein